MADGLFGGIAEGISSAQQQQLQKQQQEQQYSLGQQRLQLEQQSQAAQKQRELFARADKDVASLMSTASATAEALQQQGKDPAQISKALQPVLDAARKLKKSAGGDPSSIDAQVAVLLAKPYIPTQEQAKPIKTGSGGLEGDQYSVYNPKTGKYEPLPQPELNPPSNTGVRPPGQNLTDQNATVVSREPTQNLDSSGNVINQSNDPPALASVPPKYRDLVRGVGSYEINPETLLRRGNFEQRAQFYDMVKSVYPDYDQKNFPVAQKTLGQFATGKEGTAVKSFNVLVSHLDILEDATKALKNKDTNVINEIGNKWSAAVGGVAPTSFDAVKEIVGDEIVKASLGSGSGALGDREAIKKIVNNARSETQLLDIIDKYKELAGGQLRGLRKQYEEGSRRQDFDRFLFPETKQAFEKKKEGGGSSSIPPPPAGFVMTGQ